MHGETVARRDVLSNKPVPNWFICKVTKNWFDYEWPTQITGDNLYEIMSPLATVVHGLG
jgi:hypothetical protein